MTIKNKRKKAKVAKIVKKAQVKKAQVKKHKVLKLKPKSVAKSKVKKTKSEKKPRRSKKQKSPVVDPIIDSEIIIPEEVVVSEEVELVVEDVPEKKVKKSPTMYFTQDTEDAVIEYNAQENMDVRNNIYNTRIKAAFEKLVENIFNTFKFTYFDTSPIEIQKETVTHLVSNIEKYNPTKGKAFSYFSIVTKHYLIFHNNNNYKRFNQNVDISDTPSETTVCLQVEDKYYKDTEMSEFMKMMIEYWEKNLNKIFVKQKDLNIANAVIELFRNSDRIDAFNKKALYLYIREISSCKTQQITKVINKMKQYQNNITKSYINYGVVQQQPYKI